MSFIYSLGSTSTTDYGEGWKLVGTEDGPVTVEEEVKSKVPEIKVQPTVVAKPLPLPSTQDVKVIFEHPVPSRLFTISPVDISETKVTTTAAFAEKKLVAMPQVKTGNLVIVCANCGKISLSELCPKCYPYGFCETCHTALSAEGYCPHCTPFGVCPQCTLPRQVEGICRTDYCRDQGPVIRCVVCHKPLGLDDQCHNGDCIKSQSHSFSCETASCKKYCRKRVSGEDEDSAEARDTRTVACKLWNVHAETDIAKEAMNFYTAWGVARIHDDKQAIAILEKQVDRLAGEFSRYFDLALGGELRHCMVYNGAYKDRIPKWLQAEYPCRQARPCAWLRWKDVRDEYGISALRDAVFCFKLPNWPHSYGGNNWATIAYTLLEYLEKKTSAIVFLDSAFSLEHNCGCAFNKIYGTNYVKEALDVCFNKRTPYEIVRSSMGGHVSKEIVELVEKYGQEKEE